MWNTKARTVFLVFLLSGIVSLTYSLPTCTVVISNTGEVSTAAIMAKSGSPSDIQTAVNAVVAAGGGTVYIPAGDWAFNPPVDQTGVNIPFTAVPIVIMGAGIGKTILNETQNCGNFTFFGRSWTGQTFDGGPVRISGISFIGWVSHVNEEWTNDGAIVICCTKDFRIDHCSFNNFAWTAIYTDDNTGGSYSWMIDRGVIDHCTFDNTYKNAFAIKNASNPVRSLWAYGIIVDGIEQPIAAAWDPNINDYLGHYYNWTTYNGYPIPNSMVYIENCNFTRCRHAIAANGQGFYVARYDYFCSPAPYYQTDAHGGVSGEVIGTRGYEAYDNVYNLTDQSYAEGQSGACDWRGGGGVCFNNTLIQNPSIPEAGVTIVNEDGTQPPCTVAQLYIWNNKAYTNGVQMNFTVVISGNYVLNVNYFLRAPSQAQDGFTYTPYTYPHPLTLQATP